MIDAVGASPHDVFVAAMLERPLLAPGHGCVRCVGLPTSRERWGAAIYVQLRRSETRRRTNATDRVSQLLFCSWRWAAPLRFSRESSGTACGEERCAGSFCTNGVRGDAFENVASILQAR